MGRNPFAARARVLGYTQAQWDLIVLAVRTHLQANADKEEIPDATLRALHADLGDDRKWNAMKEELGIR